MDAGKRSKSRPPALPLLPETDLPDTAEEIEADDCSEVNPHDELIKAIDAAHAGNFGAIMGPLTALWCYVASVLRRDPFIGTPHKDA